MGGGGEDGNTPPTCTSPSQILNRGRGRHDNAFSNDKELSPHEDKSTEVQGAKVQKFRSTGLQIYGSAKAFNYKSAKSAHSKEDGFRKVAVPNNHHHICVRKPCACIEFFRNMDISSDRYQITRPCDYYRGSQHLRSQMAREWVPR